MINVAMISKWHVHAGGYANEFKALPFVNLTAVWDEDEKIGKEWAKELECEFIADLNALLAREDIDAVAVCTKTTIHKDIMLAAAKAKKAIFTEKVLACTNDEANAIAEAIKAANVPFCIALRRRTEGRLIHVKKLVESGAIGEVTHMRVRDAHDGSSTGWLPATFYDLSQCGGGAMMDLGAHPMYLSNYILGLPKSVFSMFTQFEGNGVDDNCVTVMEYANGAVATAETSFVSKACPFSMEINGTAGHIYLSDLLNGEVVLSNKDGISRIGADEMPNTPMPVALFAEALNSKAAPPFGLDDALQLTRVMEAAYKSYNSGKKVEL